MRKQPLILVVFLLCGCDKAYKLISLGQDSTYQNVPKTGVPLNVLAMGQSNMQRFSPNGQRVFQMQMPNPITFVNCTVGGTYIRDWHVGTSLFETCIAQMSHVDVVLWYQGEADSQDDGDYQTWAQQFTQIVQEIQRKYPGVVTVFAQLADDPDISPDPITNPTGQRWLHWNEVKAQQAVVCISSTVMVSTRGLQAGGDRVHLTEDSYKQLGVRFALALKGN